MTSAISLEKPILYKKRVVSKYYLRLLPLFYIGLFFIPFDNLVFAPSAGWAAISPLLFFAFAILNIDKIRIKATPSLCVLLLFIIVSSFINYVFYPFYLDSLVDTISTLLLGLSLYFSVSILIANRKLRVNTIISVLFIAYLISYIYGLLSLTGIGGINSIMTAIEKRHYDRLSYTFTEPSFISMHLYGVLLPIIYIFRRKKAVKKLFILFLLFVVTTVVFGQSSRFLLDTAIIFIIFVLTKLNYRSFKTYLYLALFIVAAILFFIYLGPVFFGARLQRIYSYGIYADASFASRWFRINASINGYLQKPTNFLFGFGVSNSDYPFKLGYDQAFLEYKHEYTDEVLALKDTINTQLFCMPIRVISDIGLFAFLFIAIKTFRKKYILLYLVTFYLYIQFDSFAFYTFWIYLLYVSYGKRLKRRRKKPYELSNSYAH